MRPMHLLVIIWQLQGQHFLDGAWLIVHHHSGHIDRPCPRLRKFWMFSIKFLYIYRKVLNRVLDSIRKLKFKIGFYSNWDWTLFKNWYQNDYKNYSFFNNKFVEIQWFHIILTFLWEATKYLQTYSFSHM